METIFIAIFALLGTAIGSFLNVCIDRLPAGKSLVYPPSHCDNCQRRLSPKDLIPVLSYLYLRGHCRHCQIPIPRRILWIEVGSGLLLAFTYWHYGLSVEFVITAFYGYLFIVLGVIDLEHQLILNKIVYPAAAMTLIINVFLYKPGVLDGFLPQSVVVAGLISEINGLISGAISFVFLLIPALISRGGMGWGDVKMAALIGLVIGFPLVLVALLMGVILGGLV
ncbi:prepilin peptidase, partial [Chloroflexota bacterium]